MPDEAMKAIKQAISYDTKVDRSGPFNARQKIHKNLQVWSLYIDMEESYGTFDGCKAAYDSILHMQIATQTNVINYANFLKENSYIEESFRAYEKGLGIFKWPYCSQIWEHYLSDFMKYKSKDLERVRDLFEQCITGCPNKYIESTLFYLSYLTFEQIF